VSHYHYILRGREPVPVHFIVFARWFHEHLADRHVAEDFVGDFHGTKMIRISTVFLGINHNFGDEGPPILFETMVFGGVLNGRQFRYSTWDEAELGHAAMLVLVRKAEEEKA
jgi:hypothetical protein